MSLPGPILIVADKPAGGLAQAFIDAGAFPVVEASWAGAETAAKEVKPSAVVLSEPDAAVSDAAVAIARRVVTAVPFTPMIIRVRDNAAPAVPDALSIPAASRGTRRRRQATRSSSGRRLASASTAPRSRGSN